MRVFTALVVLVAAVAGQLPEEVTQIVPSSIERHPEVVALLRTVNFPTSQTACGGAILNNRAVISAARCFESDGPERWRIRAGSSYWNSGGVVYPVSEIILHEDWDEWAMMTDIAVVRTPTYITIGGNVQLGNFSGPNYVVPVGAQVLTVGWGYTDMPIWYPTEYPSLHEVTLTNFDTSSCQEDYSNSGLWLRDTQLCTGFGTINEVTLARDKCFGEPGMPMYHQGVIVGIRSYALSCLFNEVPSVSTRFSSFVQWILKNA